MFITDYYTDRSGDGNDFTEVFPREELKITSDTTTLNININDDDWCEDTEDFNVYLTNIEGAILGDDDSLGSRCYASVHITDNDGMQFFKLISCYTQNYIASGASHSGVW